MLRITALPPAQATAAAPSLVLRGRTRHRGPSSSPASLRTNAVVCFSLWLFVSRRRTKCFIAEKEGIKRCSSLLIQCGALMASIAQPAIAVTGSNNNFDDDLPSMLIQSAIIAFFYFLVVPPVLMNWMRLRWYKRKFFEMYLQFMLVFIFFPGDLLLWAPFLNFRKFPRDPSMKYPWSTPSVVPMNNQKPR
ncbi:unnamed protein product [Spirodela intermedia]|uniref:Uncharacterized protein n=1 Tax=Spirodela intermedia TaxID=51605 RepID=A0A7I8ING2_SPIIN|nr:unnamed protein product [Spirodela intermedia]CAA6659408.1 unnamed protein product [Spirodela intermedia]